MQEKFSLPCAILEARSYNEAIKQGRCRSFGLSDTIVICSYKFARAKAGDVNAISKDVTVHGPKMAKEMEFN